MYNIYSLIAACLVRPWSAALFGTAGRKNKTVQHEKKLELREPIDTGHRPNIGQHAAEVTGLQRLARQGTNDSRTLAEPVHVYESCEAAMFRG